MHLMQLVPQLIYLVLKHMSPTTQNEIILWYGELPNLFIFFFSIFVFFFTLWSIIYAYVKTPLVNIPNLSIILMLKKPLVNIPKRDSIGYLMVYRLIVTRILYFIFTFLYSAFQIRLYLKLKVKM